MGARDIVQTLTRTYRDHGRLAMLHDLRCRAVNRFVQFQELEAMAVRLADLRDPPLMDAPGFQGRFVQADELKRFVGRPGYDLDPGFVKNAFAKGDRCHALFQGAELVSYGWYSSRTTDIDQHFQLHFDPRFVYMYKGYTLPAYRGRRLHAVGMTQSLQALTDQGYEGLVSFVASNNFASLKSIARMGYQIFGRAYLARVGQLAAAVATSGCQPYGFRVAPHTPPAAALQSWLLRTLDGLHDLVERAPVGKRA